MTRPRLGQVAPGVVDRDVSQRALRRIKDRLTAESQAEFIEIRGEHADDPPLVLPRQAVELFANILTALANGQGVQLMPVDAELTTQQAADMMNVSRPYLIGLLERDEIPYRRIGRHRRIKFNDLVEYLRRDDVERRRAADELTRMDEELEEV